MQRDEQLRRRDLKAYTAMILGRRETEARHVQQHTPSHSLAPAALVSSTQPCWQTPMIATPDMLLPPPTAPTTTSGTGSMLPTLSFAIPSAAALPNLDQPESRPSPTIESTAGTGASVPAPNQANPSLVVPHRISGTPALTSHDLQKHIEDSITISSNDEALQPEEAVREVIGNLSDGRKRSIPVDEKEHTRKKAKRTLAAKPNFVDSEAMNKTFADLLSREAFRSSKSGP